MNNAQLENFIGYSGRLTANMVVKGRSKQYCLHNSGTKNLWNMLAKAVAGYTVESETPQYFDIVDANGNSHLRSPILFRGKVWGKDAVKIEDSNSSSVKLTATVTRSDKRIDTLADGENVRLRMYDLLGNVLAEIRDDDKKLFDLYNNISSGTDAIFEWVLTFSNQGV